MTRRQALALGIAGLLAPAACHKKHKRARTPGTPAARVARPKVGWMQTGVASWYGYPYHGRQAANGEIYNMNELTAAHRTLPFGAIVKVTGVPNNESVTVRITDRGPFVGDRIIDLSRQAARRIDMIGPGTMKVRLQLIAYGPARLGAKPVIEEEEKAPETEALTGYAVQVGLFNDKNRAETLKEHLEKHYQPVTLVPRQGERVQWRVLVGDKPTEEEAELLAITLRKKVGEAFVVARD